MLIADKCHLQTFGGLSVGSLVPGAEEERLVHTDALPVN